MSMRAYEWTRVHRALSSVAVVASLVFCLVPGAAAQDESMTTSEHPPVGARIVGSTPSDLDHLLDLFDFTPGGVAITRSRRVLGSGRGVLPARAAQIPRSSRLPSFPTVEF
jgi:hypothetical protein